jgi:ribosomal protein S18 acetylase RimI-like enzyme
MSEVASELVRVSRADVRRAGAVLARAFQDDPLMVWAIPDADERRRILPWLIGLNVGYGCRYGEVYATLGYEGIAIWLPPGQSAFTLRRMARAGMLAALFRLRPSALRRMATVEGAAAALHQRYAPGQHWYLAQIGVDPAHQRRGVASRLLQPMLARMDAAGQPCYLETENGTNLAFYQRHGFRVVAEESVSGGGPHIWAMARSSPMNTAALATSGS